MKQVQDSGGLPDGAAEAARLAYEKSRARPTELAIADALEAAAPAIRAQERERIREALLPRDTTQLVARIDIEEALDDD